MNNDRNSFPRLLWLDGAAGLTVGAAVLLLRGWLAELHGLSESFVVFLGLVNLLYAAVSLPIAAWSARPPELVGLLAIANVAWGVVCLTLSAAIGDAATPWFHAHLVGEGLIVGAMGVWEWRLRQCLVWRSP